jgi:hypothetical protein
VISGDEGECPLPNGCTLYWKADGAGGRSYVTDEIGGGAPVWDTSLVDQSTLLAAMAKECEIQAQSQREARSLIRLHRDSDVPVYAAEACCCDPFNVSSFEMSFSDDESGGRGE